MDALLVQREGHNLRSLVIDNPPGGLGIAGVDDGNAIATLGQLPHVQYGLI